MSSTSESQSHPSLTFDLFAPARFRALPQTVPWSDALLGTRIDAFVGYLEDQIATPAKVRAWIRHLLAEEGVEGEVRVSESGLVALRVGDEAWALLGFTFVTNPDVRVCGVCGCTDDLGCWGGASCRWATEDLCTHCESQIVLGLARHRSRRAGRG